MIPYFRFDLVGIFLLFTTALASAGQTSEPIDKLCNLKEQEAELTKLLSKQPSGVDFTFAIERSSDGHRYVYHRGSASMSTIYESASTSKMVSAAIILRQVQLGKISLSARPQDLIPGWPIKKKDPLYNITLAQLLSFTSGLIREPSCTNHADADFTQCVMSIATANANNGKIPGKEYYYNSSHLQVAGLMTINALKMKGWKNVFADFQKATGVFRSALYDLPSLSNPRLAGGMHWNSAEYMTFLKALKDGKILNAKYLNQMFGDHTQAGEVTIVHSPAADKLGQDWHYGFGLWLECNMNGRICPDVVPRVSSPGAYGSYPYIDRQQNYFGLISEMDDLGSGFQTVMMEEEIRPAVEQWLNCK